MNRFSTSALRLLTMVCFLALTSPVLAAAPDEEEEEEDERAAPSVRDSALPREKGEWQISLSSVYENDDDEQTVELILGIEYGLTERLELSCEQPYLFVVPEGNEQDVNGFGDFTLGGKFLWLTMGRAALSTSLDVTFPTGDHNKSEELSDNRFEFEPMLLLDVGLDPIEFFVGAGGEFNEDHSSFVYEVTATYEIVEDWELTLGVEGNVSDQHDEVILIPEFAFPIWEDVEGAIEFPVGLTKASPDWGITFEIAWDFEWPRPR